jgi:hypothetical protein
MGDRLPCRALRDGDVVSAEVVLTGPLFDGAAAELVTATLAEAQVQVAAHGSATLHGFMNATFRHPTPYYETQVVTSSRAGDLVVNDRKIIYGPWLEGIGSRNATTRFKGYANWRRARQEAARKLPEIVERVFRPVLAKLS